MLIYSSFAKGFWVLYLASFFIKLFQKRCKINLPFQIEIRERERMPNFFLFYQEVSGILRLEFWNREVTPAASIQIPKSLSKSFPGIVTANRKNPKIS